MRFTASFVGHAADTARAAASAAQAARRAHDALDATAWPDGVDVAVEEGDGTALGEGPLTLALDDPIDVQLQGRITATDPAAEQTAIDTVIALLQDAAHDVAGPVDLDLLLQPENEGTA